MPSVTEKTIIPSPADKVWPLLRDPALVASCIPGASLSPDQGDGLWRGSIRVKFGPTVAVFRGEANLAFDDASRTCTIEGRGIDGRGASRALANGTVKVSGSDTTELEVDGSFTMSGPLETFANAGGVHVARALLGEFSANMAKKLAEQNSSEPAGGIPPVEGAPLAPPGQAPAPSAPATQTQTNTQTPEPATELSVLRLIGLTIKSWLRSIIGT
jgi:carbon monoxide dehydrogenase subunit G